MAEFCKQCSDSMGWLVNDLIGLITKEEVAKGLGVVAICEGCGPAWVDHNGVCNALYCFCFHGSDHEVDMFTPEHDAEIRKFVREIVELYPRGGDTNG